jgi:integrase/recombinase XerD
LAHATAREFLKQKNAVMAIVITHRKSADATKTWHQLEWGKGPGQRIATGIFTYTNPKNAVEKNHNKEALTILEFKKSQMILSNQSTGSGYIPSHKLKSNFLDFYQDYVKQNFRAGSRHLPASFTQFKNYLNAGFISASDITSETCENFRSYLLKKYNGETPANYFREFKRVIKSGKKNGYFVNNPAEDIQSKENPNRKRKEVLEAEEWTKLLRTPCLNHEIKRAFITSMYVGLRWCDIKTLKWENIKSETVALIQNKTKVIVEVPLHPIVKELLGSKKEGLIFNLPTSDGANKLLKDWCKSAGIEKHITWHCARLSFSVLLQDESVNTATVAGMLGHTTTRQVEQTYQRYRVHVGKKAIDKLPTNSPTMKS